LNDPELSSSGEDEMAATRREFLTSIGRVLVLVPAGYGFARLSSGCDDATASCTDMPIEESATELLFTSSCAGAGPHRHMLTLANDDLDEPKGSGESRRTTMGDGHVHVVSLTESELVTIASGGTVVKSTGTMLGHSHSFTLRLP
jgi:hypothetical protein